VAENVVNTTAAVAVHVAGKNFSPIQIIVDSVTKIFNLGVGSSLSGDATAGGGQTGTLAAGSSASSGNVQATGAQVKNAIDLRSGASVRIDHDNYSPIDIVLNLTALLFNRGIATATSGDAHASGGGGPGLALSGGAAATGLEAMNVVNMFANASVDIEGNNYAPIVVEIHFKTIIDNLGIGVATSGNVASGQSGTAQATGAPRATNTPNGATAGSTSQPGRAKGGDATAISNSIDAAFSSSQISSANGGKAISTSTITQMLRGLEPGHWDPFAKQTPPTTTGTVVQAGVDSTSGDTRSTGLHETMLQTNAQLVACSDAGVSCTARNTASMSAAIGDSSTNPAVRDNPSKGGSNGGGTSASSGDALLNATPTPTPSPQTAGSHASQPRQNRGNGSSSRSGTRTRYLKFSSQTVAIDPAVSGQIVMVDFWDNWPGRRLPPMPNQESHNPTTTSVDVSLDSWPGADELPLPELRADGPQQRAAGASNRGPVGLSRTPGASPDLGAEPVDATPFGVFAVLDANAFAWPSVDELPLPAQVAVAGVVTEQPDEAALSDSTPGSDGGWPAEPFVAAALVATVAAGVGASRRGRRALLRLRLRLRDLFLTWLSQLRRINSPWRHFSQ
jgi:hypothetical protein